MMAKVLEGVRQNGFTRAEQLLSTKEGALFCCDQEQNRCIVKSWPQGRECSLKDGQECRDAMRTLAVLHSALHFPQLQQEYGLHAVSLAEEYEKRNRELRKVRRFLREKGQKTTFEINLQQTFDLFLEEAERVTEDVRSYGSLLDARECEESGRISPLSAVDYLQLYYRFAYPEKFWKIVNFYYNSRKVWIPGRHMEKLERLLIQQGAKKAFLEQTFSL